MLAPPPGLAWPGLQALLPRMGFMPGLRNIRLLQLGNTDAPVGRVAITFMHVHSASMMVAELGQAGVEALSLFKVRPRRGSGAAHMHACTLACTAYGAQPCPHACCPDECFRHAPLQQAHVPKARAGSGQPCPASAG